MTLKERIMGDIKTAMKAGDAPRLSTLRLLQSAMMNKEIEKMKKDVGLSDAEVIDVVSSEVKKRRDASAIYTQGGNREAAQKEETEITILMEYLPKQLSEDELRDIIKGAIEKTGAASEKDFGTVMKEVSPQTKGRADGNLVSKLVKELLGSK